MTQALSGLKSFKFIREPYKYLFSDLSFHYFKIQLSFNFRKRERAEDSSIPKSTL